MINSVTYYIKRLALLYYLQCGTYFTYRGGRWDFRFCGFGQFWFGVSVFALKNCSFSVLVSCVVCGFSPINLVFGFRFLPTMMAVVWIFLRNAFHGFAKEVTPHSRAITQGSI